MPASGSEWRQRAAAREDALGVVRVQADLLPVARGQGARSLPDAVGHGRAPDVVQERGAADARDLGLRQAEAPAASRGQRRDARRVPVMEGRLQVHGIAERPARRVELPLEDAHRRRGLRGDRGRDDVGRRELAQQLLRPAAERLGDVGVERAAGAGADARAPPARRPRSGRTAPRSRRPAPLARPPRSPRRAARGERPSRSTTRRSAGGRPHARAQPDAARGQRRHLAVGAAVARGDLPRAGGRHARRPDPREHARVGGEVRQVGEEDLPRASRSRF